MSAAGLTVSASDQGASTRASVARVIALSGGIGGAKLALGLCLDEIGGHPEIPIIFPNLLLKKFNALLSP